MGWTDRDHTGRLVVAKRDLLQGVREGELGLILSVVKTFPDGTPCTFVKYDILWRSGPVLRLETIGQSFDFFD